MKKILTTLLVVIFLLSMLMSCGGEEKPVSSQPDGDTTAENQVTEHTDAKQEATEVTIEETVVYDGNNVKITAVELVDSWTGKGIKFLVENNTDKNIALSGSDIVLNGISMTANLYIDVAAGMKSYGTLDLYSSDMETAGVSDVAVIAAKDAYIYDTDNYETLMKVPFELVTSLGSDYVQSVDESGDAVFESKGVKVVAKVISEEFYGKTVLLFVKNESGKDVIIAAENVSVNGFTIDAWMYDTVYSETVRFCDLDLFSSGLSENGIEEIENVTFNINVIDSNSYAKIATSDKIEVYVNE